jgi:outer membrane assembly lipoprotein YfgL
MMRSRLLSATLLAALFLAGCASGPDKPDPTPLEPLTAKVAGRQVWKKSMSKVDFPLSVAVNAGRFTLASSNGEVVSLEAANGREAWKFDVDEKLSAGVGSDGRWASVVTRDNVLVTIDAGKLAWKQPLGTRVTTAPFVAGERVFVLGVDRSVQAFDAVDGRKLWVYQRPNDALTLSKPGVITSYKDTLVVGQGAKLVGLDPLKGTLRWELTLASPRGTNEVERLADLVAPSSRAGEVICARAFQSAVACINAERVNLMWTRNVGGIDGVGADDEVAAGADGSDRITAWRVTDGTPLWNHEKLLYRELSAPLAAGKTFIFGDIDGQVHWFARDSGEPVLRLPTDGDPIRVAPVASGLTVLVVTQGGGVFAFRPE